MIITIILIVGLLFTLAYAIVQRHRSRMVSMTIAGTSLAGIIFVLFPGATQALAELVGVGRGADLILYCWIVISLAVSVNLHFRMLNLQGAVTALTRELALVSRERAADAQDRFRSTPD